MFYCYECREKNSWPESFSKSYGECEVCHQPAICNDVPSSRLPPPPQPAKPFKAPVHVEKSSSGEHYFLIDSTAELILSTTDSTQKEMDYLAHLINTHPESR